MRYGLVVNAGGPREQAEIAAIAESSGWDGVFSFDAIAIGTMDTYDPWLVLAAMAMRTERVLLGPIVAAPSRRRPWKLARETTTLDRLSAGRLVLPVGLGALDDAGFGGVGEPTDARIRAELLDETLDILAGLWSGEPFSYEGRHYRFGPMTFRPTPIQRPRVPIWVVGAWPHERSMERVLRWDGVVTQTESPEEVRAIAEYATRRRPAEASRRPFDVVVQGSTPAGDPAAAVRVVEPFLETGATWWIDADWGGPSLASVRPRAAAGPPRAHDRSETVPRAPGSS
jgi:alkanesulfonate monooxygenase SsuD/methylene tetrahydromethanopterin reductase-like flavin-dependent oxidoreductase (luciferase family)